MATITPSKLKIKKNGTSDEYLYSFEDMTGASSETSGTRGYVPAPAAGKQSSYLRGDGTWNVPTNTKNTAGSTNDTSKLFIVGAKTQDANPQTYSRSTAYIGTDGCLYSNGVKVLTAHQDISGKADLASPTFTGTPKAPTAAAGTNNTQIATTAYVMNAFQANDAMIFKGTIGTGGTVTSLPNMHYKGWTYKVITKGTYASQPCEIGDMIICVNNGTSAIDGDWAVVQSNIDGAVVGPDTSTADHVATFSGTTGKVIKDSGFTIGKSVPADAKFTDTTYSAMTGASSGAAGTSGLVPAPAAGKQSSYLRGDGTWVMPNCDLLYTGTGTAGQAGSSTVDYIPSLWTFNIGFTPTAGDVIMVKIPVAGVNAGVWMSIDGGATYYPVATINKSRFTTQYPVDSMLMLLYEPNATTTTYGTNTSGASAGATAGDLVSNRWTVVNGYDSNTTYSEISTTNLRGSTKSTVGLITGRRLYDAIINNLKAVSGDVQLYGSHLTGQVPAPAAANNGKVVKVVSGVYALADETTELPAVTSSDNGKVLRVVNGAWSAVQLPSASGVSF